MNRFRTIIAVVLAIAVTLCGCTGGGQMGGSKKINKSGLDTQGAKDVYELNKQNVALTDASIEIFRNVSSTDKNSMVSPYSIMQAFSVCANGCAGKTQDEIADAFGCSVDELNEWSRAYAAYISEQEEPVVVSSNALWFCDNGFTPDEAFADRVAEFYNADSYMAPFDESTVEDINGWVKEKTKDRIQQLISELHPEDKAVIVNTVTFDGSWIDPYEDNMVEDGTFTAEDGTAYDARMMCSTEDSYISGDGFTGFRKPYNDGYSFVALLPDEGTTVKDLVATLDGETFSKAVNEAEYGYVHAKLPKFKSEYTADDVIGAMSKMGINALFNPAQADMSAMGSSESGNLFIGEVVHKTYIDVNETGTEAAAVTGMIAKATALPGESYEVVLDRPFVYAIVDNATGIPMFAGTCMTLE